MKITLPALALILSIGLGGCSPHHQAYPGDALEPDEVVRFRAFRGRIVEIDGRECFASTVEALPGDVELVGEFRVRGRDYGDNVADEYVGTLVCRARFFARAGEQYEISLGDPAEGARRGNRTRFHHVATIRNVESGRNVLRAGCNWK